MRCIRYICAYTNSTSNTHMKAIIYDTHGGPEVLHYRSVPDPKPKSGDVVVEVVAAALNRLDITQRNGWFTMPGFSLPHIAGMDVAGKVVEVGSEVAGIGQDIDQGQDIGQDIDKEIPKGIKVGDRVVIDPCLPGNPDSEPEIIGATLPGGYAELCLAPATNIYPVPDHMSLSQAAAFPTCYMTAAHALFDVGGLSTGETIMIHAAGSGVSSAAIQLAKQAGATILATAGSDEKCAKARQLGAQHCCNNRNTDIASWVREITDGKGVNMVLDHVGPALWEASLTSLATRGRIVVCGGTTGDEVKIPSLGHMYHMGLRIIGSDLYSPEEFATTWELFCNSTGGNTGNETSGKINSDTSKNIWGPVIDTEFPLAEAGLAQEKMLSSDFFGKLILLP